jgi:hypothetical protein
VSSRTCAVVRQAGKHSRLAGEREEYATYRAEADEDQPSARTRAASPFPPDVPSPLPPSCPLPLPSQVSEAMTRATSHRMTNSAKATQRHVRTRPHATFCTQNLFRAGRSSPSHASTTASNHCYGPSSASASHHSCRHKLADQRAPRGRLHFTFTTVAASRTSRQQRSHTWIHTAHPNHGPIQPAHRPRPRFILAVSASNYPTTRFILPSTTVCIWHILVTRCALLARHHSVSALKATAHNSEALRPEQRKDALAK